MYELIDDKEIRQLMKDNFPSGCRMTYLYGTLLDMQDERLSEHWIDAKPEPAMRITTEFARVFTEREVAVTDRPVVITRGQSTLTGTGMEFNNRDRTLRIDSEARGVWVSERRKP